jgi:hypothetical protein
VVRVRKRDTVGLNWKAPPEWGRFLEAVAADNHGYTSPYAGIAIERSFYEYREVPDAEQYANRLLEAVGRRGQDTREKTPQTRPVDDSDDGGRATIRVARDVKADMETYAAETGSAKHDVLRAVVCWYLDGGLRGRLTEKLETAVPEAEQQLAEFDAGDDRGLTADEKKRRWLADHLTADDGGPGAFTREDFGDALEAMPYRGGDTEHMRDTHLQPVLGRLGFTEHPNNPDLFVPEERAAEYAEQQGIDPDAPAFERKPYDDLTDAERIHALRVELARRASEYGGKRALRADTVRSDVFDGTPGARKVKDLMDRAADARGFETDAKGGTKRLRCDLEAVQARDVLADAGSTSAAPAGEAGGTDETPGVDADDTGGNGPETDADTRMDALMDATPVADGGVE